MSDEAERGTSERPSEQSSNEKPDVPLLKVVNADATPEEIAALVAVFSALGSATESATPRRTPEWSQPARRVRTPVANGPGGWRASSLPR